MVLVAAVPGRGRRRDERAQRERPVRGLGDRAARLQPRDHRRGACCSRRRWASSGLAIGVVAGAIGHVLVQLPAARAGSASGSARAPTSATPAARKALALLGAARARAGVASSSCSSSRRASRPASRPARSPRSTSRSRCSRSRSASSACRWASCCCRRSRGDVGARRGGDVPAAARPGAPPARVRDGPDRRRSGWSSPATSSRLLFGTVARTEPCSTLTGDDARRVPARPHRPLADRGAGSRVLRAARTRGRRSSRRSSSVALDIVLALVLLAAVRAGRRRRGDRDRRVGGDRRSSRSSCARRVPGLGLASVVRACCWRRSRSPRAGGAAAWFVERTLVDAWGRDPGALLAAGPRWRS